MRRASELNGTPADPPQVIIGNSTTHVVLRPQRRGDWPRWPKPLDNFTTTALAIAID